MKKSIFILGMLFTLFAAKAQQFTVTSQFADESKTPLPQLTISFHHNSNVVESKLTDKNGQVSFVPGDTGKYYIVSTATGFEDYHGIPFIFNNTQNIDLGIILLTKKIISNAAVTVTARKKFIEILADKTVLNIEGNITAEGNSAFELIKKAPGVTADKDENLKLKGGVATIFIDGKPSYLGGEQLVQFLKNMQSDAISKIEIIGNPGSKYDAAGSNGIINIRLRKNKNFGTNGTVTVGTGYGKYPKVNGRVALNHRTKNLNLFGDASRGYSESFNRLTYNSIIQDGAKVTYQDRTNFWHPKSNWSSYKMGLDYSLSKSAVIGFLVKATDDMTDAKTDNQTIFKNENFDNVRSILTTKSDNQKLKSQSYNLNFRKTLDSAGSEWGIDADYITYNRKAENINDNNFIDADGNNYRNPYIFRNGSPADIEIKTAKTDYTKQWSKTVKMEVGLKYSNVKNENLLQVDSLQSNYKWTQDNGRTNNFIYTEKIAAGYLNFTKEWTKLSVQLGLRAEHTNFTGNSTTLNLQNDSSYLNLFPSAFATYRLNDRNTFNGSYSRRIDRPSYQSLNPFISFIDPLTQFEGNPNLKASFTQSFEMKHSYNNFLYSTLSYSYTKAQTTNVILQDKTTGAVRNITANVGNSTFISLNESASLNPTKWWSMDNSISLSTGTSSSTYPGYEFNQKFVGADASVENSFTLNKSLKVQLSGYYSTPYKDGITKVRAAYGASAGIQKTLWNGKGNLKINYNNFIGPNAYRAQYLSNLLNIKWVNQWEGRRINASFSYKFGNKNVKSARQRNAASGTETNRVNL